MAGIRAWRNSDAVSQRSQCPNAATPHGPGQTCPIIAQMFVAARRDRTASAGSGDRRSARPDPEFRCHYQTRMVDCPGAIAAGMLINCVRYIPNRDKMLQWSMCNPGGPQSSTQSSMVISSPVTAAQTAAMSRSERRSKTTRAMIPKSLARIPDTDGNTTDKRQRRRSKPSVAAR